MNIERKPGLIDVALLGLTLFTATPAQAEDSLTKIHVNEFIAELMDASGSMNTQTASVGEPVNTSIDTSDFTLQTKGLQEALGLDCVRARFLGENWKTSPDKRTIFAAGIWADNKIIWGIEPTLLSNVGEIEKVRGDVGNLTNLLGGNTTLTNALRSTVYLADKYNADVKEIDTISNGADSGSCGLSDEPKPCAPTEVRDEAVRKDIKLSALVIETPDDPAGELYDYYVDKVATSGVVEVVKLGGDRLHTFVEAIKKKICRTDEIAQGNPVGLGKIAANAGNDNSFRPAKQIVTAQR